MFKFSISQNWISKMLSNKYMSNGTEFLFCCRNKMSIEIFLFHYLKLKVNLNKMHVWLTFPTIKKNDP